MLRPSGGSADIQVGVAESSDQRRHRFGRRRPNLAERLSDGRGDIPPDAAESRLREHFKIGDELRRNLAASGPEAEEARRVLFGQRAR